jgi:ankyrin repeat protein
MGVCMASTDESADAKTKIARVMIDAGADVNSTDKDGMTPLIMGIGAHSKSYVALLLDHGAKVNARNNFGVSPMSVAMGLESTAAAVSDDPQAYRDIQALLRAHGGVK